MDLLGRELRDVPGGTYGSPETPVPSPAVAGEQYSSKTLSDGVFIVRGASVHTSNAYEESCRISQIFVSSGGAETEVCLEHGSVSQNRPFVLSRQKTIVGPGYLRAYVINLAATSFSFAVSLDKIGRRLM